MTWRNSPNVVVLRACIMWSATIDLCLFDISRGVKFCTTNKHYQDTILIDVLQARISRLEYRIP
jgi:hypothetical protein